MCKEAPNKCCVEKEVYIKELIARMDSDKKVIMLIIAFELAIVVFTGSEILVSERLKELSKNLKLLLVFSLFLFLISSWLHYLYYRKVHLNELALPGYLIEGTKEQAKEMIFNNDTGLWAKHGYKYTLGNWALAVGLILYLIFFTNMIFK